MAIPKLRQIALEDSDVTVRQAAVMQLNKTYGDQGTAILISLYDAIKEGDVQRSIIQALGFRKDNSAKAQLLEIAKSDPDPKARVAALESMRGESGRYPLPPPGVPVRRAPPVPPPPK